MVDESQLPFDDEETIGAWARELPASWSQALAARLSLRTLPIAAGFPTSVQRQTEEQLLETLLAFRSGFVCWCAHVYPDDTIPKAVLDTQTSVQKSVEHMRPSVQQARALVDLYALASNTSKESAGAYLAKALVTAMALIRRIAEPSVGQIAEGVSADLKWLNKNSRRYSTQAAHIEDLMRCPLWLENVRDLARYTVNFPDWARRPFDDFDKSSAVTSGIWRPWTTWYRVILNGSKSPESAFGADADIAIAKQPSGFWERAPSTIMSDILMLIQRKEISYREATYEPGVPEGSSIPENPGHEEPPPVTSPPAAYETRLAFLPDAHDVNVDLLSRGQLAFVLAGRLNQAWDDMNNASATVGGRHRSVSDEASPGFVIHIDAPWGGGKSSFAGFLKQILNPYRHGEKRAPWLAALPMNDEKYWPKAFRRPWNVVTFNAWRHQHVKPPWWVLYDKIRRECLDAMVRESNQAGSTMPPPTDCFYGRDPCARKWLGLLHRLNELRWRLWTPDMKTRVRLSAIAIVGVCAAYFLLRHVGVIGAGVKPPSSPPSAQVAPDIGSDLAKLIAFLIASVPAAWTILTAFTQTLFLGTPEAAKNYSMGAGDPLDRFRRHFAKTMKNFGRPIMVIVDDLDRCDPDYIVELVRGMQTILLSSRVIFVLLGDRDWIEQAFTEVHKSMRNIEVGPEHEFGGRFVEKAIQFSFVLPDLSEKARHQYVRGILGMKDAVREPAAQAFGASADAEAMKPIKQQLESILNEEDYKEREQKASALREAMMSQNIGQAEKNAVGREMDVKLSLRAAADLSAQEATSHRLEALAALLPPNPRQVKRIVNAISLIQEAARLEGVADPNSDEWYILARWIVLMIEWPKTWFTLSRYPELADAALGIVPLPAERGNELAGLVVLLKSNASAMKLLNFSDLDKHWPKRDITSKEIMWLRLLLPATSGRLLNASK